MRAGVIHFGLLLIGLIGLPVLAATIDVTAEYKPAAYEAGYAKFINTTTCNAHNWAGFWCNGSTTVDEPSPIVISMTINRVVKNNGVLKDALNFLGFSGARDVSLTREGQGTSHRLKFMLTGIGAYMYPSIVKEALVTDAYWLDFIYGDCQLKVNSWASSASANYFYEIKSANQQVGGKCYHNNFKPTFSSKRTALQKIYLGYRLQAPDPLKMPNGIYKGSLTLSIGPNKDLDFGNGTYSDSELKINFTMTVRHQIKIEFPAGGNRVVLQPPGGWREWIHRGRLHQPPYLRAELLYKLWSSSGFQVSLRCQYLDGDYCMLKNTRTDKKVRFDVLYQNGRKLEYLLSTKKREFRGVSDRPELVKTRQLTFKVDSAGVTEMMKTPGSTYKGNVTIIYDVII